MITQQGVYKTLLIGLGSTGTRIVERLMAKVNWELGAVSKAPWIEYLALETDESEFSKHTHLKQRPEDTFHIGISEADFAQIRTGVRNGSPSSINVSNWADHETLTKLSDSSVKSGVGNIRMIGRLAFLHRPNFETIKSHVITRLDRLRGLTELEAAEQLGQLPSGVPQDVKFATDKVQVYVVGALAGGTASGCVSDVGFFLRTLLHDGEVSTSILTVPRPTFTSATAKLAERLKKNAYHALVELNHYHLPTRQDEAPIQFADGTAASKDKLPYDLTFVLMPKEDGREGEGRVNQAVADRLFLNIFAPLTNTAGEAVNATPFGSGDKSSDFSDRDHRAHVFCTFGLSVVDFPVQRVVEACQKRLLERSLSDKLLPALDDVVANDLLNEMQIGWDKLTEDLFADDGDLENFINGEVRSIRDLAAADRHKAGDRLSRFARAFGRTDDAGAELADPGGVTRYLRGRRRHVVRKAMARVERVIARAVEDQNTGLKTVLGALRNAIAFVKELEGSSLAAGTAKTDLSAAIGRVEAYKQQPLVGLLGLKSAAVSRAKAELDAELRQTVVSLKRQSAANALVEGGQYVGDVGSVSILADLKARLTQARKRAEALETRLQALHAEISRESLSVENATPDNGVTLFETGTSNGGTVSKAYQAQFLGEANHHGLTWQQAEATHKRQVLGALAQVAPQVCSSEPVWLDQRYNQGSDDSPVDSELYGTLNDRALAPFRGIERTEVVSLLEQMPTGERTSKIESATSASRPFLDVNEELVIRGGRSPIAGTSFALIPKGADSGGVQQLVRSRMASDAVIKEGIEPHRIVIIHERYRFPLSGVPTIVETEGSNGAISAAECTDFPTFWTRKDVAWTGVSDGEIVAHKRAEEAVAAALLVGVAEVAGGHLVVPGNQSFGTEAKRYLPGQFRKAVGMLANGNADMKGNPITAGTLQLTNSIKAALRKAYESKHGTGNSSQGGSLQGTSAGAGITLARFCVEELDGRLRQRFASPLDGLPASTDLKDLVYRFVARQDEWFPELARLHPLSEAQRELTWRTKGAPIGNGEVASEHGFWCPSCGGLIGRTEQEATLNGWRCYAYPDTHNRETNWGKR